MITLRLGRACLSKLNWHCLPKKKHLGESPTKIENKTVGQKTLSKQEH